VSGAGVGGLSRLFSGGGRRARHNRGAVL